MFSNNQKISIRQTRRLLILDLFGVSSLLLPGILAGSMGPDGIFSIIAGAVLWMGYLWMLEKVMKKMEGDYFSYMVKQTGQIIGVILMLFYLFFFILLSAFVLFELAGMVRTWLLPEGSYGWICLLLLGLAGYAALRGIEGRARIYEILFWFLGVPLIVMLLLAVRGIDFNYWTPIFTTNSRNFFEGTGTVFAFFLPVLFVLFLKPYCTKPQKLLRCAKRAVGITACLNVVIYLILIGSFQSKTVSILERPAIILMSMVKIPGGFFARQDAFMTAIWFFSMFALMNTGVFYSGHTIKQLFGEKKTNYGLAAVLILIFGTAMWFFSYPNAELLFAGYIKYLAIPVLLILPLLLFTISVIRQKMKGGARA